MLKDIALFYCDLLSIDIAFTRRWRTARYQLSIARARRLPDPHSRLFAAHAQAVTDSQSEFSLMAANAISQWDTRDAGKRNEWVIEITEALDAGIHGLSRKLIIKVGDTSGHTTAESETPEVVLLDARLYTWLLTTLHPDVRGAARRAIDATDVMKGYELWAHLSKEVTDEARRQHMYSRAGEYLRARKGATESDVDFLARVA